MLAALLLPPDCEVHVPHDGPSALAIARTLSFDAALLDIGCRSRMATSWPGACALPTIQHTYLVAAYLWHSCNAMRHTSEQPLAAAFARLPCTTDRTRSGMFVITFG